MKIFRRHDSPLKPAETKSFVGQANTGLLASSEDPGAAVHVYRVEFGRNGRTNWHAHSGPQWLFIVDGRIRVQKWGDAPIELETGDAVVIAAGEKHWHGAAPESTGTHLAVNINVKTEWMEPVTDADYRN